MNRVDNISGGMASVRAPSLASLPLDAETHERHELKWGSTCRPPLPKPIPHGIGAPSYPAGLQKANV